MKERKASHRRAVNKTGTCSGPIPAPGRTTRTLQYPRNPRQVSHHVQFVLIFIISACGSFCGVVLLKSFELKPVKCVPASAAGESPLVITPLHYSYGFATFGITVCHRVWFVFLLTFFLHSIRQHSRPMRRRTENNDERRRNRARESREVTVGSDERCDPYEGWRLNVNWCRCKTL